ncbi:hypothetical protein HPB47_019710 [Ixodes persulcatus]|uniref:Uncharacterized protein n=1 Tax=Ixodes persulcatus TaxID=34615 RepID=A0AC60QK10_IXOPE|nr:hypothetical protein HPB47_019710 [Ixodes persulcatus]
MSCPMLFPGEYLWGQLERGAPWAGDPRNWLSGPTEDRPASVQIGARVARFGQAYGRLPGGRRSPVTARARAAGFGPASDTRFAPPETFLAVCVSFV